ncbi:MAG: M20/M25/M40 family metallo-hydrolase, partial [Novosphingobium sp.]
GPRVRLGEDPVLGPGGVGVTAGGQHQRGRDGEGRRLHGRPANRHGGDLISAPLSGRIKAGLEEIRQELERVIGMPVVKVTAISGEDSISSPASPMRPDFVAAVTRAVGITYPGVTIVPSQASGATDSMWYRALGVPAYGASPTFSKDSEDFAHGLNERVRLSNIKPGINYFLILFTDLSK